MIAHIIVNSHLDPVWLWKREQGIDEVIATARTACDMLDLYPELIITRGEAWFYETVEKLSPELFARIKTHVDAGRWKIVGGWYVQPDCNLASPETYIRHGEYSCAYFRKKFGIQVRTGYNVDSFGHCAMLPSFYRSCGIENYIMMRPMAHEMDLPKNNFIWKSPKGDSILTARLPFTYATWGDVSWQMKAIAEYPETDTGHVLCFIGVGDHGGGPARREIDYILEHRNDFPGVEFRFSHPDAYFDAIRKSGVKFPVVKDELQHHAVGCYSANSKIKREVREAEIYLTQMERFMKKTEREFAWKQIMFASFHDVLAGSCIRSAYQDIYDSLGLARKLAFDAYIQYSRKRTIKLPPDKRQRVVFDNLSSRDFNGLVYTEPALCVPPLRDTEFFSFYDEKGNIVPAQQISSEESAAGKTAFLLPLSIPAGKRRIIRLDYFPSSAPEGNVSCSGLETIDNRLIQVKFTGKGVSSLLADGREFLASPLKVIELEDNSDTWSHNLKGYTENVIDEFHPVSPWKITVRGSYMTEFAMHTKDSAGNELDWYCGVYDKQKGFQLRLRLCWKSEKRIVKLLLKPAFSVKQRFDGIPGAVLKRALNGEEYPVFNRICLQGAKHSLTVVSRDIFSLDVQPDGLLRLTLLRSPYFAHHIPQEPEDFCRAGVTERGSHDYTIVFLPDASPDDTEDEISRQTNPIRYSDTTKGVLR